MQQIDIYVPAMGEGIVEATITKWLKKEGEKTNEDETIVEIATDKVDSEIPAPKAGIIEKILLPEGSVAKVGQVIAILNLSDSQALKPELKQNSEKQIPVNGPNIPNHVVETQSKSHNTSNPKHISPLVRSFAARENIPLTEILKIKGSGINGRITKNDLIVLDSKKLKTELNINSEKENNIAVKQNILVSNEIPKNFSGQGQVIEMDRVRRLIADHMVKSKQTAPHVCSFIEADMTAIVRWREKEKLAFEQREKEKLTYTPVFFNAVAQALRQFPMVNVSVDGNSIIVKNNINLGMAVALPNGNLIVPVIKNADQKNLYGLTKTINELANRARINKLLPDEIQGGTFTITNLGSFGTLAGTPIINQPESAILGIGAIRKMPAVIEAPQGDLIGIRHKVILSLSYDHRVIDGYLAGQFLSRIVAILENFDQNQTI